MPEAFLLVWEEMGSSREFLGNPFENMPRAWDSGDPARPRNNGRCQVLPSATLTASASQHGQISELLLVACFLAIYASHPPVTQ